MGEKVYKIGELNTDIKNFIEGSGQFDNIHVVGEIANLTKNKSGHIYFSLKDEESNKIECMMWKFNAHKWLSIDPKVGTSITAIGRVTYYVPYGKIAFEVKEIRLEGVGELQILYDKKFKEFETKGYFDQNIKKPIPKFPKNIGIVTAATGAAVKDLITTIKNRNKTINIFLFPSLVQGLTAANDIAKKIEQANKFSPNIDVLIVGRGGGSYEDLWSFNEDVVIEAIHNSKIPIISAVGHEPDFTLADYVADLRSATPTAAGVDVTKIDSHSVVEKLDALLKSNANDILVKLRNEKTKLNNMEEIINSSLSSRIKNFKNIFKNNIENLNNLLKNKLLNNKKELSMYEERIKSSDPIKPLRNGFALIRSGKNIVRSSNELSVGQEFTAEFIDGIASVEVKQITKGEIENGK